MSRFREIKIWKSLHSYVVPKSKKGFSSKNGRKQVLRGILRQNVTSKTPLNFSFFIGKHPLLGRLRKILLHKSVVQKQQAELQYVVLLRYTRSYINSPKLAETEILLWLYDPRSISYVMKKNRFICQKIDCMK